MTVYFIQDEKSKNIKIGFTSKEDVNERVKDLQTGNPNKLIIVGTIEGDEQKEKQLHSKLIKKRGIGEWFKLSRKEAITIIKENGGKVFEAPKKVVKIETPQPQETAEEQFRKKYPNIYAGLNEDSIRELTNMPMYVKDFEFQTLEDGLSEMNKKFSEMQLPEGFFLSKIDFNNPFFFDDKEKNKKPIFIIKPNFNFNLHIDVSRTN